MITKRVGIKLTMIQNETFKQTFDILFEQHSYDSLKKVVNFIEKNRSDPIRIITLLKILGIEVLSEGGEIPKDTKFILETYQNAEINDDLINLGLSKASR